MKIAHKLLLATVVPAALIAWVGEHAAHVGGDSTRRQIEVAAAELSVAVVDELDHLLLERLATCRAVASARDVQAALQAGETETFSHQLPIDPLTPAGQWQVKFVIDLNHLVGETDETNNAAIVGTITVIEATIGVQYPGDIPIPVARPVGDGSGGEDGTRANPMRPEDGNEVLVVRKPTIIPSEPIRPELSRLQGGPPWVRPIHSAKGTVRMPSPNAPRTAGGGRGHGNALNVLSGRLFQIRDAGRVEPEKEKSGEKDEKRNEKFQRIRALGRLR